MKVLVFTEGTILMHKNAEGVSRETRVVQYESGDPTVKQFHEYIPVGNAVRTIKAWKKQGIEIYYLTSRERKEEIKAIRTILKKYNFPDYDTLLFRDNGQTYADVAEHLLPDVIVEDDCESIGGEKEMVYFSIKPELRKNITLYQVEEFGGIDHLISISPVRQH
jgi:hypothetical protein